MQLNALKERAGLYLISTTQNEDWSIVLLSFLWTYI